MRPDLEQATVAIGQREQPPPASLPGPLPAGWVSAGRGGDELGPLRSLARWGHEELAGVFAVAAHYVRIGQREKIFTLSAMLIPINYLFLFIVTIIDGGTVPTALVVHDNGPYAQAFLHDLGLSHSYAFRPMDAAAAAAQFRRERLVAVLTIPADFDAALRAGRKPVVSLQVNNLDSDFTADVQRAADIAVNSFSARMDGSHVLVRPHEIPMADHQIGYAPYVLVSTVVLAAMIGGMRNAGMTVAQEYESGRITELMLAPRSRLGILVGIMLGTCVVASLSVALMIGLLRFGWHTTPANWPGLVGASALVLLLYTAFGVLLGTVLRSRRGLSALVILLSLPLLSLSGAFYPASWSDSVIAHAAKFTPTYYANGLFQRAFHAVQTTQTSLLLDYVVLIGFLVAAVGLSAVIITRREQRA